MIIQKSLETRLDLYDPEDILDPDLKGVCMKHLTKKFAGKCYKSCLIIKINKILRHSQRYMSDDLTGSAYITVNFEVDGIVYSRGEIINGCNIVKIEADGRIHAKSKYAGIQIRQDSSLMSIYKEGQTVPFITRRVLYNPAQSAISVEALPFTPSFPELEIYRIKRGLDDNDKLRIQHLFGKIKEMTESIGNLDSTSMKAIKFFQDLLYPFKQHKENKLDGFAKKKLTWEQVQNLDSGYLYQPAESRIQDLDLFHSEGKSDPKGHSVYEKDLVFILDKYLNGVILHYSVLMEFVETYPTFTKVQEYKDIWRMFNMLKR